ncbi:MAG: TonB-dependent receptor [Prevotella sp.]|nr:TonB-dependent receptor [Prevotella sp.]
MKKRLFFALMAAALAANVNAQNEDSLKMERLQEVVVSGVRTQKNAPYAVTNLKKQELGQFSTTGQELPFLFARTPGVLAWSENGLGTGTVYMRIRGASDSRINVTLDGVPLNSPEDQCVFWANMNSYGSLLGSVQIQRGVGTSTNGDGAFGGTVALSTAAPLTRPAAEVSASYGSYSTYNLGGSFSTGLLGNHFIFDGAYHETQTDGFIHGTRGRSGSYYGGLTWLDDQFQIRFKNIGNFEKTGQAWNGVTAGNGDYSLMDGNYDDGSWGYQTKTGIKTYEDMYNAGLGRFNSLYERLKTDDNGLFVKDANGNYLTERYQMADGSYWPKTTDNFHQNHSLLSMSYDWQNGWAVSGTLHYTYGYGYYDEFRPDSKVSKFGLPYTKSNGKPVKSDAVRQKGMTQNALGALFNAQYRGDRIELLGGFSAQMFNADHFGYLTYLADQTISQQVLANGKYRYYDSDADKVDVSAYLKASYNLTAAWKAFADVQYRHVDYKTSGINDRFYQEGSLYYNQPLDVNEHYNFLNPKVGISWSEGPHHVFASAAMSHREPERNNFTDNYKYPFPKAESLLDYELGYNFSTKAFRAGVNLYYMDYTDQFVQTGELSEIGENLTTNIDKSYRMGVELTAAWDVLPVLTLEGNAALSQNKLKDFTEMASVDWDDSFRPIHYDNATLAFSPSAILNGFVDFHWKGLKATWHTNFVSRQYLDNTENEDRSLPSYSLSDLHLSYTLQLPKLGIREAIVGLNMNNVFNARVATSGWVYSSILDDYGHPNENRYYQIGFIPMAGRTIMGSVTLRF